MPPPSAAPDPVVDVLGEFSQGMNSGVSPLLLPKDQLSFATNCTMRGTFVSHRPPYQNMALDFQGDDEIKNLFSTGLFQGATSVPYEPDEVTGLLCCDFCSISGRIFMITPSQTANTATVTEVTPTTGANDPNQTQAWFWQAENYMIVTDGLPDDLPIFITFVNSPSGYVPTSRRSQGDSHVVGILSGAQTPKTSSGTVTASITTTHSWVVPPIASPAVSLQVSTKYLGTVNDILTFPGTLGSYTVTSIGTNSLGLSLNAATPLSGFTVAAGTSLVTVTPFSATTNETAIVLTSEYLGPLGVYVQIASGTSGAYQLFEVMATDDPSAATPNILVKNLNNTTTAAAADQSYVLSYPELPAGRMGAYGMGRVWMCLTDGKQFVAGDIVGGASGTPENDSRDAVLCVNENTFLTGGGYFTVPSASGDIRAMIFVATLDSSLGQGPLQILTPREVFSCFTPVDRITWSSITNPILTESLISNGGVSAPSVVTANGDIMFRSVDGIRSLLLGRRDFDTWGNVPISREMDRVLSQDNAALLPYCSAAVFDNRMLMTCASVAVAARCVFWQGLIALNFDPLSSLKGKAPSVYDGLWTGLNTVQLSTGLYNGVERCFAFTFNQNSQAFEYYEIKKTPTDVFSTFNLPTPAQIYDNGVTPILWTFESPALFSEVKRGAFLRLIDGEVYIDNLVDTVDFQMFYKPDQYPCWTKWFSWSECAKSDSSGNSRPQFRPRMGLGEPQGSDCDPSTGRPMREGYTFQVKLIVRGHCRFLGQRTKAAIIPQPLFAPPLCAAPCTDNT